MALLLESFPGSHEHRHDVVTLLSLFGGASAGPPARAHRSGFTARGRGGLEAARAEIVCPALSRASTLYMASE
jgi:hypothetical protein